MNYKLLVLALLASLFLVACSERDDVQLTPSQEVELIFNDEPIEPLAQRDPLPADQIDRTVLRTVEAEGEFWFENASDHFLWSAVVASDSSVAIGYQPADEKALLERIHQIDFSTQRWTSVREALLAYVQQRHNAIHPDRQMTAEQLDAARDERLPAVVLKIWDYAILAELRRIEQVRFVEPIGYRVQKNEASRDAGCSGAPRANPLYSADYRTVNPNASKVPWNYDYMNIEAAWGKSQGDNVTVGVIDTGTDPRQSALGSSFASGWSGSRTLSRYGTYNYWYWWPWSSPDGPNDDCGHGTQMAGLIAAPRKGYSTIGVAYKANLAAVRGTDDVLLDGGAATRGVRDALYILGGRSDVKVVSMSIGWIWSSSYIVDGLTYAYNRDKLIFAAAGTSSWFTSWYGVIFPANHYTATAVTGVTDRPKSTRRRCNICHEGSAVEFVAVMQRDSDANRTSLTLSYSGNTPSYVGGSSAATATMAGIAALVYSKNPGWNRSQVLAKLRTAGDYYPNRDNGFGWGVVDANAAVSP